MYYRNLTCDELATILREEMDNINYAATTHTADLQLSRGLQTLVSHVAARLNKLTAEMGGSSSSGHAATLAVKAALEKDGWLVQVQPSGTAQLQATLPAGRVTASGLYPDTALRLQVEVLK